MRKQLPPGWRWVKLGEVCNIVGGSTPDTGNMDHWGGDIVWITPTDIGMIEGKMISRSSRMITRTGYENCGTELLPVGTVVMSSRAPIGYLGIAAVPLCTNQGCKSFVPMSDVDSVFLYWLLKNVVPNIQALGSGATFSEVSKTTLQQFEVPLPSLTEQRRIAAILNEQTTAVERARSAVQYQLDETKSLPAVYLRVFPQPGQPLPPDWFWGKLGEVASLLPSKSIASDGDTEVRAVTTACLTETGFNSNGIKTAKMWSVDAMECELTAGEILIARSNTSELVGRAALYRGSGENVVASDLTIRVKTRDCLDPEFATGYLACIFTAGYWCNYAGGASGSMKKITRTQVCELPVPIAPISEQRRIASVLKEQLSAVGKLRAGLTAQLEEINVLPAALLRRAFNGEL